VVHRSEGKRGEAMNVDFINPRTGKINDCLLFIRRLKKAGFTEEQVLKIVTELEKICPECFDSDCGCPCWNDE
jgi:hypothetical protein